MNVDEYYDDDESERLEKQRYLREMHEDSYAPSNRVEFPESTGRKPVKRAQMSLFDQEAS